MAEVMKFEDFKNEGTEVACKVINKFFIYLFIHSLVGT